MKKKEKMAVSAIVGSLILLVGSKTIPGVSDYPTLAALWGVFLSAIWVMVNNGDIK